MYAHCDLFLYSVLHLVDLNEKKNEEKKNLFCSVFFYFLLFLFYFYFYSSQCVVFSEPVPTIPHLRKVLARNNFVPVPF